MANVMIEFLERQIEALRKEADSYEDVLKLFQDQEISPGADKILSDMARKDNRFLRRTKG